jgi:N-acyl homoserine lactone hydrolase
MSITIHPLQTGWVRIKSAQVEGKGRGLRRRLALFRDRVWTGWLPTYAWVIDHPEGVIVVDTGQGRHLLDHTRSWHPYVRWEVAFRIEPEEIGPQLKARGFLPKDVRRVVLTHLHMDHDGGLRHLPESEILVDPGELGLARGLTGRLRGYLPHHWPKWFDPVPLRFEAVPFGPFPRSLRLTADGAVIAVPTPGHTPFHSSVLVRLGDPSDTIVCLAGDVSYTQDAMLRERVDGVAADEVVARQTLRALRQLAAERRLVYLPTHDPDSGHRLDTLEPASTSA